MAAVDPQGSQKYWINGEPFQGVRLQSTHTGNQKNWFEGLPVEDLIPDNNADTGKFFLLFE